MRAAERKDFQRVVRPTGAGSGSITVEPYFGAMTAIGVTRALEKLSSVTDLDSSIEDSHPELRGSVASELGSLPIQGTTGLLVSLTLACLASSSSEKTDEAAISSVLSDLSQLLATNTAVLEEFALLVGITLAEDVGGAELESGVTLRALTDEEIAKYSSFDVSIGSSRADCFSAGVKTVLVVRRPIQLQIGTEFDDSVFANLVVTPQVSEIVDRVLLSLHILTPGRASVFGSYSTLQPAVLPGMQGRSSWPLTTSAFPGLMILDASGVARLKPLYSRLSSGTRSEIKVAAARLRDAENRLSAIDSLLDSVIGLETLLNPNDSAELAFRVALNFAFLGPPASRRSRYENIRDVQRIRNKIVHGGLNATAATLTLVNEHSVMARASLRDVIAHMLEDEAFAGNGRLDADFWLDRVIPPQAQAVG